MASPLSPQAPAIPTAPMGLLSGAMRANYLQNYNEQALRQFQMDDLNQAAQTLQNQRQGMENDEFSKTQDTRLQEAAAKKVAAEEVLRMYQSGQVSEENDAKHQSQMGEYYSKEQLRKAETRALGVSEAWTTMEGAINGEGGWMATPEVWADVRKKAAANGVNLPETYNPAVAQMLKRASDAAYQALPRIREKMMDQEMKTQGMLIGLGIKKDTAFGVQDKKDTTTLTKQDLVNDQKERDNDTRRTIAEGAQAEQRHRTNTTYNIANERNAALIRQAELRAHKETQDKTPEQALISLIKSGDLESPDPNKRQLAIYQAGRYAEMATIKELPKRLKIDPEMMQYQDLMRMAGLTNLDPNKATDEQKAQKASIQARINKREMELHDEVRKAFFSEATDKYAKEATGSEAVNAPTAPAAPGSPAAPVPTQQVVKQVPKELTTTVSPAKADWIKRAKARNPQATDQQLSDFYDKNKAK